MKRKAFLGSVGAALLAAGLSVAACGGSTAGTGAAATATAPASPTATATASPTETSTAGSLGGIPFYQPSHVESHTGNSAQLSSPDSVTKVTDFYVKVAQSQGWTTVSKSVTPYNGNLTIKKAGQGANIAVYPSGTGSRISISSYPTG